MTHATAIILEDDPFWSEEIAAMLRDQGVQVFEAGSVDRALQLQTEHPEASFVVDIILPERDGIEFIQAARAIDPDARVIAVSGGGRLGADFYLRLAETFGASCTLAKPFNTAQLSSAWSQIQA